MGNAWVSSEQAIHDASMRKEPLSNWKTGRWREKKTWWRGPVG